MTSLAEAVDQVLAAQRQTHRPLAIVLAGHNGSGKSTLWERSLSDKLQMPLVNADRMMMSILPRPSEDGHLTPWAAALRDENRSWMQVAQQGVLAFVGHAMAAKVAFAMETVFSHWEPRTDGTVASKVELIKEMQAAGYFVLLVFVGLASAELSVLRVETRRRAGGHTVDTPTLHKRFPKTQQAIGDAVKAADASILTDNSREQHLAFTVCRVQLGRTVLFDLRGGDPPPPPIISAWMDRVIPLEPT